MSMPDSAPPSKPALIELNGVTKVYGSGEAAMQALRGVDLRIETGDFVRAAVAFIERWNELRPPGTR